ncbi:MAG: hypothetical protein ABI682_16675 [Acidobacteriota bacterium]
MFALAGVAAAARLWLLLSRPLWHDEIFTLWASRLSFRTLIDALRLDSGPPLFYVLEKPFVRLAEALSLSDTVARVLPWIAASLLALFAMSLPRGASRRWFVLLCSAAPLLLLYGAEARAYALLALIDLAVFVLLLRGPESGARLALGGAAAVAGLMTHSVAILFTGAAVAVAAARGRWRSVAALCAAGAVFAPWIPVLLRQPREAAAWIREPVLVSAGGFLSSLGGAGRLPPNFGVALPAALVLAGAAVAVAAALFTLRSADPDVRAAAALTLLTLAGVGAVSLYRPAAFAGRTEMAVLAVWLWGIAAAARSSRPAKICAGAVLVISALSAVAVLASPPPRSVPAEAVAALVPRLRPGDAVVAGAGFYLPARLAADRGKIQGPLESYPSDLALHPGWFTPRPPTDDDVAAVERSLSSSASGRRKYFLLHPLQESPKLAELLAAQGTARVIARLPDAVLILFVKK